MCYYSVRKTRLLVYLLALLNLLLIIVFTLHVLSHQSCRSELEQFVNHVISDDLGRTRHPSPFSNSNGELSTTDGLIFIANIEVPDWKKTRVDQLTFPHIIDYLLWTNQSSCQVTQYFGGQMISLPNDIAGYDGQKAICLDRSVAPIEDKCLAYSFGINFEWSFDNAMELNGCQVYAFDPSMNTSDYNHTKAIHFYQLALDSVDKNEWNGINYIPSRTLSTIYNMLKSQHGEAVIDYLKIDIEGAEWRVLTQILQSGMFDKVRQLGVEIHIGNDRTIDEYKKKAGILQSLEDYGMVRFDSKLNIISMRNFTEIPGHHVAPMAYEIAWYNSKLMKQSPN